VAAEEGDGVSLQKQNAWRCQKYLDWVKTQPSCVSGIEPCGDAHHMKGHGMGGSVKAPDWASIPLTREEHAAIHLGWQTWEGVHGSQWEHVAKTLGRAIQEGIITIKGMK